MIFSINMVESAQSPKPAPKKNHRVLKMYLKTAIFGVFVFGMVYGYQLVISAFSPLNKAAGDTAIILIGISMVLSSFGYFWDVFDRFVIYRKFIGLIGVAFFVVHLLLSWDSFMRLFQLSAWEYGFLWAPMTGLLAAIIFLLMTLISNQFSLKLLGPKKWRYILRTGYVAMFFVWLHVVFLSKNSWLNWYRKDFPSLPSSSLLIAIFIFFVLYMRVMLEIDLRRNKPSTAPET